MVMALEVHERPGASPSPDLDVGVPSPDLKPVYKRQVSDSDYSQMDTPRKNKRKLSEPKRRTTDFSIKRFCPDSPGSACSESGRSEESTPERPHDELRDSPRSETSPGISDKDAALHPHLRPPFVFSDIRTHPYFIPQFYYNRFPGYPGSEQLSMFAGFPAGLPGSLPAVHPNPQAAASAPHAAAPGHPKKRTSSSAQKHAVDTDAPLSRAARESRAARDSVAAGSESSVRDSSRTEMLDNDSADESGGRDGSKKCRKNYKNMTRERRVEANARERSRVHTISAAFEGLRRAVPSYSYNQKLSKLAILRIACSYINALTKLTEADDEGTPVPSKSFAECVDTCTRTIQTEGKARRRH